ncbi:MULTISPECIES: ubiquitin-like protein Pup [Brevibacterium]|uniref:Prokaryotic ubiquitin-like protein Pup n=2 Tax=Brevibacterium TaxID=1696 RepID=A0A1H1Y2H2_BRESA|nr:ubiquitin-like protein Pup [Brevibacterium sandarakinum]MDN5586085.1 ubiquitin-like protein Pup [Brevibacterium sp.]MDN5634716.1 ubiquitin-like protein Pup [Brevibacterium sp.]MDN5656682.1 ubiquitin-like protein Pup [Brevibacterium sandarakinum]SDT15603.1 prokaryotic ubiquitin-like protein Pup [Brevibacterium sandarakinum]
MSSQEQVQRDHSTGGGEPPAEPPEAVQGQINTQNVDSILDEIDGVLESNAEEFVRNFVQKGGQ